MACYFKNEWFYSSCLSTNHLIHILPHQHEATVAHQPGGHQVVVVEHLDESLDLGPLGHLLLAHGGGHLAGVAVDAGDQSVTVRTVGCAVVDVLKADDTCLLLPGSWYRCGGRLEVPGVSHANKKARRTLTMTALRPA